MPFKQEVADKLQQNKEQIINWYTIDYLGFKHIARKLSLQDETIRNFLIKNNIEVRKGSYSKLLKYKEEIIAKHLIGKNTVELSKEYGTCEQTIANFLYKYNDSLIHRRYRKYEIKQDYFSNIDTWEKAYFLGWIFTDGTVPDSGVHINLQERDIHVLETFSNWLNLDRAVTLLPNRRQVLFYINSVQIVKDLRNIGIQKNKTFNLPNFYSDDLEIMRGFILGLTDGDGCFTYNKNKKKQSLKWYLCGACESFLEHIANYITEVLNVKIFRSKTYYTTKNNVSNWHYRIAIYKKEDILTLLDFLYKDIPKVYLQRKLDKCIEFFRYKGIDINL